MNLYSADFAGAFVKAANTDDLDAAVLIIMEIVGIDTGDYASHFFDGEEFREQGHEGEDGYVVTHRGWPDIKPARRLEILHNYAMNEIRYQFDHEVEKAKEEIAESDSLIVVVINEGNPVTQVTLSVANKIHGTSFTPSQVRSGDALWTRPTTEGEPNSYFVMKVSDHNTKEGK